MDKIPGFTLGTVASKAVKYASESLGLIGEAYLAASQEDSVKDNESERRRLWEQFRPISEEAFTLQSRAQAELNALSSIQRKSPVALLHKNYQKLLQLGTDLRLFIDTNLRRFTKGISLPETYNEKLNNLHARLANL